MAAPTPDDICGAQTDSALGLTLRLISGGTDEDTQFALVEGPPKALRFLADLLAAAANQEPGFDFSLSPKGAGSFHFSPASDLGLYLNVCSEDSGTDRVS
jgi:hypothetical protein